MFPLIPDLQKELAEYLYLEELEYLLVNDSDVDLEYEVISSDKWWRYLAISKYNFILSELHSFKEKPLWKTLLPLFLNNKIASGASHSLALDNQGKLYAWGENNYGQLGLSDRGGGKNRAIPTQVAPGLTFRTIAAGSHHSLALDNQGKLYAWGFNSEGQLGLDEEEYRTTPTPVVPKLTFSAIAAGLHHSLALDNKGKLYAWGDNYNGQLGLGDSGYGKNINIPTLIKSELTFRTIAAGEYHTLALNTKGKLYAWGANDFGQLGLGDSEDGKNRTIPTPVAPELTFRTIAAGSDRSLALDNKGKLYAWGSNDDGQLGLGDGVNRTIPTPVVSELTFRTIAAGAFHSLALDNRGKLYSWGENNYGQLGLGDRVNRTIPTPVAPELTFKTIAAGHFHTLALDNRGKLYAWGWNGHGQLGLGDSGRDKNRTIPRQVEINLN
jgi:alpha-tubulin suppressor-like RCC1 family protein